MFVAFSEALMKAGEWRLYVIGETTSGIPNAWISLAR
jgi:hypothetical protein